MRILFITSMGAAPWGGSEELWSQAAIKLAAQGHDVTASVMHWPKLSPRIVGLESKGMQVHVRRPETMSGRDRLRRKILGDEERKWFLRQQADLVIISQGSTSDNPRWMQLCQQKGVPYVSILQCNSEGWWPNDGEGEVLAQAYQKALKVYGVSHANLDLLQRQLGIELANAEVVWNPVNLPADQIPPAWPSEREKWKLACVGRLEPSQKGQDLLFQVLARPQWRERAVEVNLYGTGPSEQNLRKLVGQLGLKQVHFGGHLPDVAKIWAQNHLLVLPSRYEGLPLALVEAMCCARAAVVTDSGSNAEMCFDGETGFVARAPTIDLVAEALERAWEAREKWQEFGQAARRRFDSMVPGDPVAAFCEKLLGLTGK